MLLFSILFANA